MLHGNPFSGTDFGGGAGPMPSRGPGDPDAQVNMPPDPPPPGDTPPPVGASGTGPLPPDISLGMDPEEAYYRANRYWSSLLANPNKIPGKSRGDPPMEDPAWANQLAAAEKMVAQTLTAYKDRVTQQRADALREQQRADLLSDRAASQADSAAARAASQSASFALAQTTHQLRLIEQEQQHQQDLVELAAKGGIDTAQQREKQGFTQSERVAGQDFTAQENSLDREIRNRQNEIAAGNLNLGTALGQLKALLDAQPYTLPKGAEYVPGFQPGGGVQEAARLAGVSYNPANYKANTVPFDPASVVKQTMGR